MSLCANQLFLQVFCGGHCCIFHAKSLFYQEVHIQCFSKNVVSRARICASPCTNLSRSLHEVWTPMCGQRRPQNVPSPGVKSFFFYCRPQSSKLGHIWRQKAVIINRPTLVSAWIDCRTLLYRLKALNLLLGRHPKNPREGSVLIFGIVGASSWRLFFWV